MSLEDLTTYVEVDPFSRIVVDSLKVVSTGVNRRHGEHLYKDFTSDFFGDFVITGRFNLSSAQAASVPLIFCLQNATGGLFQVIQAAGDAISLVLNTTPLIYLRETDSGVTNQSSGISISFSTNYWIKLISSGTDLELYVYDDAAMTSLVGSVSLVQTAGVDYRYFYPSQTYEDGINDWTHTIEVGDINLNPGIVVFRRRMED